MAYVVLDGLVLSLMAVTCGCTRQLQNSNIGWRFCENALRCTSRIGALEQRKGYFGNWQNEVADRLPGNKTASMRKFGTPAPKTMENTRLSPEGKRGIESLLKEHGLYSILIKFQFTSVTNLRTEGMFEVYNRDQVVPSALELKYLSS